MSAIDKFLTPPSYENSPAGKIRLIKETLWSLETQIGKQPWLTMVLTIVDFQEARLLRPDLTFPPIDKAIKTFQKWGGM